MIKLFTTHCPKCNVLEKKLKAKNIPFEIEENMEEMIKKGFQEAPILQVGDDYLDFVNANAWVNVQ